MEIELNHPFKLICNNLNNLLNVKKISSYCSILEKQSKNISDRIDPNRYIGDGFEFLIEALLKLSPIDNRLGITNYTIVSGLDTGVDGYGIGINGNPATIQCKYRQDHTVELTANKDELSNFISASQNRYGVKIEDTKNMFVYTTANKINWFTNENMLFNKVKCIGWNELRTLLDNNFLFWYNFKKICGIDV